MRALYPPSPGGSPAGGADCRHCGCRKAQPRDKDARGLCQRCAATPSVRSLYRTPRPAAPPRPAKAPRAVVPLTPRRRQLAAAFLARTDVVSYLAATYPGTLAGAFRAGLTREEIAAAGAAGAVAAAGRYDPRRRGFGGRRVKFRSYAVTAIRAAVQRAADAVPARRAFFRRMARGGEGLWGGVPGRCGCPREAAADAEAAAVVRAAVAALPDRSRRVVELLYGFGGVESPGGPAAVANELRVSKQAVRDATLRAFDLLRPKLLAAGVA